MRKSRPRAHGWSAQGVSGWKRGDFRFLCRAETQVHMRSKLERAERTVIGESTDPVSYDARPIFLAERLFGHGSKQ